MAFGTLLVLLAMLQFSITGRSNHLSKRDIKPQSSAMNDTDSSPVSCNNKTCAPKTNKVCSFEVPPQWKIKNFTVVFHEMYRGKASNWSVEVSWSPITGSPQNWSGYCIFYTTDYTENSLPVRNVFLLKNQTSVNLTFSKEQKPPFYVTGYTVPLSPDTSLPVEKLQLLKFTPTVYVPTSSAECSKADLICDGRKCINVTQLCDGEADCMDGSDEEENNCRSFNVGLAVGLCLGILSLVTSVVIGTLWYKKSRRSKKQHVIEPPSGMTARNSMGEEIDAMSTHDHKDNSNGIIDSVQEERRVQLLGDITEISSVSRPSAGQVCVDKSKQRFHTSVLPSPTPVDMPAKRTVEPSKPKAGKMRIYNIGKDSTCIGQENALHAESILLKEKEESWEIDLDRLRVSDVVLGEGEFGIVNKGSYRGKDVAVKQLKDGTSMADKNDLLSEIKMLKQAGRHPNIVSLVGVCTREEKILVVTEIVPYGSLKNFLISKRVACVSGEASRYVNVRFGLNDRALLKIAFQIALGMQFLEKKKCVHRDLSARNVFIGENLVAKVGDFGLARDVSDYGIYTKISSGRVPWRWLSLESLKAQVYTAKSDVWSYGIVLWEIATYGEEPYPNTETPRDLLLWLSMGNRMSRPEHSSEKLYEIMCLCWIENPLMRPTFADITKRFPDCLQTYKNNYMNILKEDDRSVSEVSLLDGVSLSRTGNMTTTV